MTDKPISPEPRVTRVGAKARDQLLEAAGEVFAAKGLHEATSREICEKAGMNTAAVNYHFGGFEALYMATLVEAHRRAVRVDDISSAMAPDMPARDRLRAFMIIRLRRILQPISQSWEIRLLSREVISPTASHTEFFEVAILPEHRFMRSLLGEILDRPPDDPTVSRALFSVVANFIFLAIADRSITAVFMPDLSSNPASHESMIDDFLTFMFAGLDALAAHAARPSR